MSIQEKMFGVIEQWFNSGLTKKQFLIDHQISEAKFNYWISKWKLSQEPEKAGFEPINLQEQRSGKVLEITTATGLRITVFA